MSFRPSRRQIISGMAALGTVAAAPVRSALAQAPKRIPIPEGEFTPQPIAIPNFVAGTPGDAEVGVGVAQVITNNLKRSGLFAPIDRPPSSSASPIPTTRRSSRVGSRSARCIW